MPRSKHRRKAGGKAVKRPGHGKPPLLDGCGQLAPVQNWIASASASATMNAPVMIVVVNKRQHQIGLW